MTGTKARWIGHKLRVSVALQVSDTLQLASANAIAAEVGGELADHIPGIEVANVTFSIPTPHDDRYAHGGPSLNAAADRPAGDRRHAARGARQAARVPARGGLSAVVVTKHKGVTPRNIV
jgi:hypothetical protein